MVYGVIQHFSDIAGLSSKKLSEIFSKSFLIPLEDTDNQFQLQVCAMVTDK